MCLQVDILYVCMSMSLLICWCKESICGPVGYRSVSLNHSGDFRGALNAKALSLSSNFISTLELLLK